MVGEATLNQILIEQIRNSTYIQNNLWAPIRSGLQLAGHHHPDSKLFQLKENKALIGCSECKIKLSGQLQGKVRRTDPFAKTQAW